MTALIAAPTNLGLRPPQTGAVPGTAKAPEALREAGLHRRLAAAGAVDAGVVLPGRYVDDDATRPAGRVRNEVAVLDHARRTASRIAAVRARGQVPVVLGGDCSLVLAAGLALRPVARSLGGVGLVHVDGHTDFRHPGNSPHCASLAGEDLALAIGRHWPHLADPDGAGPLFDADRTVHLGCRDDDEHLSEVRALLADVIPASEVITAGTAAAAQRARQAASGGPGGQEQGCWVQVDVDVLDPVHMPAVDSPDRGGLDWEQLVDLLAGVLPWALGVSVTVFDPDLDPDGRHAAALADLLVDVLPVAGAELVGDVELAAGSKR